MENEKIGSSKNLIYGTIDKEYALKALYKKMAENDAINVANDDNGC